MGLRLLHQSDAARGSGEISEGGGLKILFVASECVPFCKSGGLADVVGALPKVLKDKRHDVRVILPKYKTIRSEEFGIKEMGEWVRVSMGPGRYESADIRSTKTEKGIP